MFHCQPSLQDRSLTISRRLAALLSLLCVLLAFAMPAHAQSTVPTDLRIGIGNNSLTLYWQPAANASNYNVYRGTSAGHESTTPIATGVSNYNGNAEYYTDSSAVNGTTYYYKVTAVTFNGESGFSNEASGTPGAAVLPAPVLTGTPGNGTASLHWSVVAGSSHYDLYRSIGPGNGNYFAYIQNITGTSYTDTLLNNGTTYNYFVAAVNTNGSGTGSNGVAVTPGETTLPAPTNVHVYTPNGNSNYLVIAWNTVPNASGYNIYRGTSAGGEASTPYSTSATSNYNNGYITYFNDTNVTAGTTYYYKVSATNGVGESAKSVEANGVLNASNATVPVLTATAATGPSKVTLTWSAVSGATGYDLYKAVAGSGSYTIIAAQTGTTYSDSSVNAGVPYSYFVSDYKGSFDEVGTSNTVTVTPGGALLPSPKGFVAQPYNGSIALTWTPSAGASSYNLYRSTSAGGEGSIPLVTGINSGAYPFPNPSYIDSNVTAGTTYYYKLTAANNQGESPQTGEVSAVAGAALLPAPTLTVVLNASNQAVATWSAVTGATSYNVYRSIAGQAFTRRTNLTTTTYTDTNVSGGVTYTYYVCAVNTGGQGTASNQASVTPGQTALPAPAGLVASSYSGSQVLLAWNPVPGASSYDVYQGTSAGGEGAVPVVTGATNPNSLVVGGLTSGTRYYFEVTAVNSAGESAKSNEASAKPGAVILPAPSLTASSPSSTEIDLKWTSISGASGYSVYRSVGATGSYTLLTAATTNSYKDTGLTTGLIYAYYVVPFASDGAGSASNTVSVALGSAALPAPTGLYAFPFSTGDARIRLVWNAVPGASSYNVYRGTSAGGESSTPLATGLNSAYTGSNDRYFDDTTAVAGTVYYYKVSAVNGYGESAKSSEATATSEGAALAAPTLTAATSSTSITLSWSTVSGATSYTLRRADSSGYYTTLTTTTSTSYTDSTAIAGVTYSYFVFANSTLGSGSNSNIVTASVNQKALSAPTGLVAYPNNGYVSLYWNTVPGATNYNVYRSTSAGGEGSTPIQTAVGAPTYTSSDTVSGLTNGTKYYFEVTAVSAAGQSGKSNEASAVPNGSILSAPTLSVSSTSGQASLTWSSVSGATSYAVFRAVGSSSNSAVFLKSVTTTSTTDTGLTNGLNYTYTVIPIGANGDGTASNAVTVLIDGVVPPAPGGVAGYPEGSSYNQIIWSPVPGITSYNIYRGTSAGGEGSTPYVTNVSSVTGAVYYYNDSNVTAGTTYYYKITAVNSVGESAKSSEISVLTGGATLGAPSLTATYSSSKVNLAWSAVSGAKSYNVYRNYAGQGFLRLTNVTGTTYSDSAITSGVPVSYYVCAVSAAGQGAGSNTVSLDPGGASLAAPTGLTATNDSNANIYLTWNPSPGATSYNLYRGTQAGHEAALPVVISITGNAYTDASVTPGTGYYYQVTALNIFGESGKSNEASVTDANTTLAAPTLKGTTSGTSAVLTWSAVSGATKYNLYRNIAGAGYTLIASTTSTTVTDTGLTAGVPVSYYVTTVNSGGLSSGSNTVTLTIGSASSLPAPTGVYAYAPSNYITIAGNVVPGASSYNIYRGTSAGGEGATPFVTGVTSTSNNGQLFYYYDYNVTATTTYYYFVTAVNGLGESGHSNEASVTYGVSQLPAPTLIATGSTGKIALTWTAVSGATSYNLFRSVGATGNFAEYKTGLTGTTYTDSGLTSGVVYEYLVAAVNKNGQGANSNTVSLYAGGSVLAAPFGLVATVSGASAIYIQWNFVPGATGYNVYRGTSAGGEGATPIATGVIGSNNGFGNYTDSGANVQGQAYYYFVTAINGTGESAHSNEAHAVTGSGVTIAPTLVGVGSSAQVVLTWNAVAGATSYTLYRNAGAGFVTYQIGLTGTTYTDASLTNGQPYQYYLCAVTANNQGNASNTVTVVPTSVALPAPTGVEAYANGSGIIVAWNYVPGATGYNVYRGTSAGGESGIPIATGVTQTYNGYTRYYITDAPLTSGQTYYYKVSAVNATGESAKSQEISATVGGSGLPAPTLSAVPGSNTVALTWTAVTGATAYRLFRSDPTNSNYYTAIQSGSTATTYTDSTAKNGLTYSYVVEAYNTIGSGVGSNTVTVTVGASSGNPLPAPNVVAQAINNGVTLSFTTVPGATSYIVYRGTASGGETPIASGIAPSGGAVTSYTDSTAANYTAYYYKVAAQDSYGVGSPSSEVSATPPTTGAADFLLTAAPAGISIAADDEDTVNIGLLFVNNLTTPVSLTVTGAPSGVTASFDPPSAGSGGSYLDIAVSASASPGTYTLTVKGTDGTVTHTTLVTLQVVAAGSNATTAKLTVHPWDGKALMPAKPVAEKRASLLNDIGRLGQTVTLAQVQTWKSDLHQGRVGILSAAQMHLWLGEYALAHNEQPEQALAQFRIVRRTVASLPASYGPGGPASLRTLASYDSGFALFYMGAYAQARDAFHALLTSKAPQPGLDSQTCTLWWRHSLGCAGYHTARAALGIPEPPRLDPKCGVAALAACLRGLNQPYAQPRLLASCRVTGEGSHMSDLVKAAPKLGVTMNLVVADDRGLMLLPKPVVAYVEHDHFIAVTQADASGVSYLCSDCGAWPGGGVHLTWAQWHKMDATDYGVVTVPGSAWDHKINAMEAYEKDQADGRALRVASMNLTHLLPSVSLLTLAMHIHPFAVGVGPSQGCGQTPDGPKCPPGVCCPEGGPGPDPGGPQGGDPANLATGEEEYTPAPDITVYNPYGPQVTWSRIYGSLRSTTESAYQYNDFGAGWSQTYNVGVYDPNPNATGTKYVFYPNGSRLSFSAPSVPSATTPIVQCTTQPGARMLVEWDYNNGSYDGSFKITFADRTKWVTTGSVGSPYYCSLLSQLIDRNGNAIAFSYQAPVNGSLPLLQTITDPVHGTKLLSIKRANDGTGNIVSVNDAYGRSIYYHSSYYAYTGVPGGYPQGHQDLDHISETVKTFASSKPDRSMLGYVLATNREGVEKVAYLGSITVPSPTGSGTSTAFLNYDPSSALLSSLVDGNGNTMVFNYVNANGQQDAAGSYTQVDTYNASNQLEKTYTVSYDNNLSETAMYTPAAPAMAAMREARGQFRPFNLGIGYAQYTYTFSDPNNPYKPSSIVDANGHSTSSTWDQYGNVLTSTSARGTVTTNTYVYTNFALGECTKTVIGAKSPTTYTYYEPSGLVKTIVDPLPGTVGSTSTATITYTYNGYGDITSLVDPGNNAVSTNTRTFSFGSTPKLGQIQSVTDNLGHKTSFTYDSQGNELSQTDALSLTTNFSYDIANNQTLITYPATVSGGGRASQSTTYLYPGGPKIATTSLDESGTSVRKVSYAYGPEGELLSTSGSADPVTYTYNSLYQPTTITDGNGHASHYYYTTAGFLAAVTAPGYTGSAYPNISGKDSTTYPSYDPLGNPLTRVDGNGKTTTYTYNDPENKRTDIAYPSGTLAAVHYTYDAYGRRSKVTDGTGSATTTYDDRDNVLSVATTYTGVAAKTVSYTYYADGSRKTMVTPAGTYTSTYDGGARLTGLTNPYSEASSWTYYNNNVLDTQKLGNASAATVATTTYTYNNRLFLTDLLTKNGSGTTLSEYGSTSTASNELLYDGVGNRTQVTASLYSGGTLLGSPYTGKTTFTYDNGQTANAALNRSQITKEVNGSTTTSYAYDGGATGGPGNPTTFRGATVAYDDDNQISGTGFAYDGNGNPTTYRGTAMTYDVENHMTAVGTVFTAAYTADGLRAWKQNSSGKTYYLYDGGIAVCELSSTGSVTSANTFGVNGLVSRHVGSTTTFYTWDPQRNVAQTLSSTGAVLISFHVDSFGNKTSTSATTDPYSGFDGQDGGYTDSETGLTLFMLRYYDSGTGRFLTRDPTSYDGGINVYAYAKNNPVNFIDPTGLDAQQPACTPPPPNHCQRDYNDCIHDAQVNGEIAIASCTSAGLAAVGLCLFTGPGYPVCLAAALAAAAICDGTAVAVEKYAESVCARNLQHCQEDAGS